MSNIMWMVVSLGVIYTLVSLYKGFTNLQMTSKVVMDYGDYFITKDKTCVWGSFSNYTSYKVYTDVGGLGEIIWESEVYEDCVEHIKGLVK